MPTCRYVPSDSPDIQNRLPGFIHIHTALKTALVSLSAWLSNPGGTILFAMFRRTCFGYPDPHDRYLGSLTIDHRIIDCLASCTANPLRDSRGRQESLPFARPHRTKAPQDTGIELTHLCLCICAQTLTHWAGATLRPAWGLEHRVQGQTLPAIHPMRCLDALKHPATATPTRCRVCLSWCRQETGAHDEQVASSSNRG